MLSQDILLGDTLKTSNAGVFLVTKYDGTYCGCALGGALLARGYTQDACYKAPDGSKFNLAYKAIKHAYPWMTIDQMDIISIMYIDLRAGKCTLEQIADYARSIEPAEEKVQQLDTEDVAVLV